MSKLKTGILFTSVLAVVALPLAYLRNWLLSQFGESVVADYAIILLISSIVSTFFLFGASTVYSMYLPKISDTKKQVHFIFSSSAISIGFLIIGVILVFLFPEISTSFISDKRDVSDSLIEISFFIIVFGLGQIVLYSLIGLEEYKISAVLNNIQPLVVVIFLSILYFAYYDLFLNNSFSFSILLVSSIWLLNFFIGLKRIFQKKIISFSWFLPPGFWKQATFIHLGTLLSFSYGYIDQILVLSLLGRTELAVFFLTIQVAGLVNFISLKLMQVFQSSFSSILNSNANNEHSTLTNLYNQLASYNIFISFSIAIFLVIFGDDVMLMFSKSMNFNSSHLFILVWTFFIGSLGGIHSTILQAKEKNEAFFTNNVIVVFTQIILSVFLVKAYGVLGVIIARLVSTVLGQIGLAFLLKKKSNIDFFSPLTYFTLVAFVLAVYFLMGTEPSFWLRSIVFITLSIGSMKLLKIDIRKLWN